MSQTGRQAGPGTSVAADDSADVGPAHDEGIDLGAVAEWLTRHRVVVIGIGLIIAQMIWKILFISHLYFRVDDFLDLDRAIESRFTWSYLTYNGVGHLIIGLRAIAWPLARISLYNWKLDAGLNLALVLLASLAALRLLRTLFGDRSAILVPLTIFLFCPLTLPALGEWSSGLESEPLQIAIFMALDAHVRYLRSGNRRYFAYELAWVIFGLAFFEKGLILPPLLLAVTAAYFAGPGSLVRGLIRTATKYWREWVIYAFVMAAYAVVLARSLRTSTVHPSAPTSARPVEVVTWGLAGKTFLPAVFGGPWRWFSDGSFALAAPPATLVVLSIVATAGVIGVSIWLRQSAWRAWLILAAWLAVADILPIIIGRVSNYPLDLLASETRYVADAVPVLMVCIGLAYLPIAGPDVERGRRSARSPGRDRPRLQLAMGCLMGAMVFGSILSVQSYEQVTSGKRAESYVTNAARAVGAAPRGTLVADAPVPVWLVISHSGNYIQASELIGDIERDSAVPRLTWTRQPLGTIDNLMIFGPDGRLYPAQIRGTASRHLAATGTWHGCWPVRHGFIVVKLAAQAPRSSTTLRIGYLWGSVHPAWVSVRYAGGVQLLQVRHGLHTGYIPVFGSARRVIIGNVSGTGLCVGDAEAGSLVPDRSLPALPPRPH